MNANNTNVTTSPTAADANPKIKKAIPKKIPAVKTKRAYVIYHLDDNITGVCLKHFASDDMLGQHIITDLPVRCQGKYQFPTDTKERKTIFGVTETDQRKLIVCGGLCIGWEQLHMCLREYACTPEILALAYVLVKRMVERKGKRVTLTPAEELLKQYFYSGLDWEWGHHKLSKKDLRAATSTLFNIELPDASLPYLYKLYSVMKAMWTQPDPLQ